jgi:hypothetical protein
MFLNVYFQKTKKTEGNKLMRGGGTTNRCGGGGGEGLGVVGFGGKMH